MEKPQRRSFKAPYEHEKHNTETSRFHDISPTKDFISLKLNLRQKHVKPEELDILWKCLWDQIHTNTDLRAAAEQPDQSVEYPMTDLLQTPFIVLLILCVMGYFIMLFSPIPQHLSLQLKKVHDLLKNVFCSTEERKHMRSSLWVNGSLETQTSW